MNSTKFEESSLRPTYMSQAEANEVMDLWAERQREEAARQSLITVHDVAEATQLSSQDVERLLLEVRSTRPRENAVSGPKAQLRSSNEPTLLQAYVRLAPYTAVFTAWLWSVISHMISRLPYWTGYDLHILASFLGLYSLFVAVYVVQKFVRRWVSERVSLRFKSRQANAKFYG